jgi:hypothetical protein
VKFDQAIVFYMDTGILMLSKGEWFSELITISDHDHYDEVYSVDKLREDWSNEGEDRVEAERSIRQI